MKEKGMGKEEFNSVAQANSIYIYWRVLFPREIGSEDCSSYS